MHRKIFAVGDSYSRRCFEERSSYTEQLNAAYRKYFCEYQIPFIGIYKYLVDGPGKQREVLIFDYAHINNSCADLVLKHHSFQELD